MKDPVDHVLRPTLPWRSKSAPAITECGYDASKVRTITREEFLQRLKDYGRQRCALLTCMTCSDTAQRMGTWADDPRLAVSREVAWETGWRQGKHGQLLKDELLAIERLIEAHQDQFSGLIAEIVQRREWIEKKTKSEVKPQTSDRWRRL